MFPWKAIKKFPLNARRLFTVWRPGLPSKRDIKYLVQRFTRGWDDSETWSLDASLAKLILPRLRRFKEVTIGHPADIDADEWSRSIDKMIETFEFISSDDYYHSTVEQDKMVREGLKLFAENYRGLWY